MNRHERLWGYLGQRITNIRRYRTVQPLRFEDGLLIGLLIGMTAMAILFAAFLPWALS